MKKAKGCRKSRFTTTWLPALVQSGRNFEPPCLSRDGKAQGAQFLSRPQSRNKVWKAEPCAERRRSSFEAWRFAGSRIANFRTTGSKWIAQSKDRFSFLWTMKFQTHSKVIAWRARFILPTAWVSRVARRRRFYTPI